LAVVQITDVAAHSAFFGYSSRLTMVAETVREAARKISKTGVVDATTWEDLQVSGQVVIDQITDAIDAVDVGCFDVTTLNANVMFEMGYALGRARRIWLILDRTDRDAKRQWNKLRIVSTLGYATYASSDEIRGAFLRDNPHLYEQTYFERYVQPAIRPGIREAIFYLRSNHQTDASRQVTEFIHGAAPGDRRVTDSDPSEATYPLSWYAQQIYSCSATLAHLSAERQIESDIHNARSALIAGLAHGMGKPVLMLAEGNYLAPIDYRDLVFFYDSANGAVKGADEWLRKLPRRTAVAEGAGRTVLELATELSSIRFGEPVAENEEQELVDYFLETASFKAVLQPLTTVFVGRKGTGKSANFVRASEVLRADVRNLVVPVRPYGVEMTALVDLLGRIRERDYVIEALWQYLLYTEIARAMAANLRARAAGPTHGTAEWDLVEYVDDPHNGLTDDFAIRLERAVASLRSIKLGVGIEQDRLEIKNVHGRLLGRLHRLLSSVLIQKSRVAVLIDNLDKAWERGTDLEQLSRLVLGLLSAARKVGDALNNEFRGRGSVSVSLSVFLRSDIYERVLRVAREPDKIRASRIVWDDRQLLLRVLERRYEAAHPSDHPEDLWARYFVHEVNGTPIKDYILQRILPRPRDAVQFCNAALDAAINARHDRIDADDLEQGGRQYSNFAIDALLVENGLTIPEMEAVLLEFMGAEGVLTAAELGALIQNAGLDGRLADVIDTLRDRSFLGLEVAADRFDFSEESIDRRKADVLARKLEEQRGRSARYSVHPAYHPFLDIHASTG
jgi:hypothetical protein